LWLNECEEPGWKTDNAWVSGLCDPRKEKQTGKKHTSLHEPTSGKFMYTASREVLADILLEKKDFTVQKITLEEGCINKKFLRLNWQIYVT